MKLTKNKKMIVVGSSLLLSFLLMNFQPSDSHPATQAKSVLLLDISGKPLRSVFERLPADPLYPEFKRLAEKRLLTCDGRSNRWGRFKTMLGLSFESVVHAQGNYGGCGYSVSYTAYCSSDCGGNPYDGDLTPTPPYQGIIDGTLVCKTYESKCPGVSPTVNCGCGGGGPGCTPADQDCLLDYECCSGACAIDTFTCRY